MDFSNIIGKKYGFLTIKEIVKVKGYNRIGVKCLCDCGNEKIVRFNDIKMGKIKSCGCFLRRSSKERAIKHGLSRTRIYRIYDGMVSRCKYKSIRQYKNYGGRGINVCDEWLGKEKGLLNFYNWAIKNGYNDSLTIDRIDNNKGYSPENCRWVDLQEQSYNKTTTCFLTHNGITLSLAKWCKNMNFNYKTALGRFHKKKDFDYIFSKKDFRYNC